MPSTLSTAVAEALRAEILSGTLAPGAKLPTEAALIARFSLSRTVIREALGTLRAKGMIRSVRGSGSFVLAQPRAGLHRITALAEVGTGIEVPTGAAGVGVSGETAGITVASEAVDAGSANEPQRAASTAEPPGTISSGGLAAPGSTGSLPDPGSGGPVFPSPANPPGVRADTSFGQADEAPTDTRTAAETPMGPVDHAALLEFRIAVETESAALGARRRTAADLSAIATALQRFDAAGTEPAASLQADIAFHRAIAEAGHNPYFTVVLDDLGPAMITMPDERFRSEHAHVQLVNQEHRAVHDSIRDQDPQGAAAAMRTHLLLSLRRLGEGA